MMMSVRRPRFTIRGLMIAIAFLSVCLAFPMVPLGIAGVVVLFPICFVILLIALSPLMLIGFCFRNQHRERY